MKCSNCGMVLPDDSEFCQFCGAKIMVDAVNNRISPEADGTINSIPLSQKCCTKCGMLLPEDSEFCQYCGTHVEIKNNTPQENVAVSKAGANEVQSMTCKNGKQPFRIATIILAIACAILVGLASYQFFSVHNTLTYLRDRTVSLQAQVSSNDAKVKELESTNKRLQGQVDSNKEKANQYDKVVEYGSSYRFGYAAESFRTSTGVLVISEGSSNTVRLTTSWQGTGTVSWESKTNCASIDFTEDNWDSYTNIVINANRAGVDLLSLSNTHDSNVVRILVIVK